MPAEDSSGHSATSGGHDSARRFGALVRARREELRLNQAEVALATGLGRRFIIELEAGKPTCQLGKALLVAEALGLRLLDTVASAGATLPGRMPALPPRAEPGHDALSVLPDDEEDRAP